MSLIGTLGLFQIVTLSEIELADLKIFVEEDFGTELETLAAPVDDDLEFTASLFASEGATAEEVSVYLAPGEAIDIVNPEGTAFFSIPTNPTNPDHRRIPHRARKRGKGGKRN